MTEKPSTFTSKILLSGKVTVPIELREIWDLREGDSVEFEIKKIIKERKVIV